jgi:cytochrome P450
MNTLDPIFALEPDAVRCPYPHYASLRQAGRVFHDAERDVYVVSHHADIVAVNTRPQVFSNQNPMGPAITEAMQRLGRVLATRPAAFQARAMTVLRRGDVLFTADPPEHSRHRRILNKAMTPSAVRAIEPLIEAQCRALAEAFVPGTRFDLLSAYARPAPVLALATLLGVPLSRADDFYRWASAINATIGTAIGDDELLAAIDAQMEFWDYFEAEIQARIASPGGDLLSAVTQARSESDAPLSINEMVGFCSQLVAAGSDTTTKLIAAAVYLLARDPALDQAVRADSERIPAFLEEVLRLEPPVQGMFRVATAPFELDGVVIPVGALVWSLYGSGNRDAAVFACPDAVDLNRPNPRGHLSFGHGPHVCIGATLARAVARIAMQELLAHCPRIELAEAGFVPDFEPSYVMHGMTALPVRVGVR